MVWSYFSVELQLVYSSAPADCAGDFEIKTDHLIQARRRDLVLNNKQNKKIIITNTTKNDCLIGWGYRIHLLLLR